MDSALRGSAQARTVLEDTSETISARGERIAQVVFVLFLGAMVRLFLRHDGDILEDGGTPGVTRPYRPAQEGVHNIGTVSVYQSAATGTPARRRAERRPDAWRRHRPTSRRGYRWTNGSWLTSD
jgi:hypothetical protein